MAFDLSLPSTGAAHIWYADLNPARAIVAEMERVLVPDEWTQLHRYHFADDARRYAVRRGVLRHLLAAYLSAAPEEIAFSYGPRHKPALARGFARTGLHFNLSDSGEVAAYAFTVGQEVGIDIEVQRVYPDALELADRFFSRAEATWLRSQPAETASSGFLRCWTCKESVVKALSDGLMAPLQQFTAAHWQTPPQVIWPEAPDTRMSLYLLDPPASYTAALAVAGGVEAIHAQHVNYGAIA